MNSASTISTPLVTPQDAIGSYMRWRIALQLAAQMREPLSQRATRSVEHPEECALNKWLLSEHTRHMRNSPQHRSITALHVEFHKKMGAIANLLRSGEYDEADRQLNKPGPFQDASNALAHAIMCLKNTSPASATQRQDKCVRVL